MNTDKQAPEETKAPEAPSTEAALREALTWIMRFAEKSKEPCGMDPESPAAIRNGAFASIAQAAAQGLGMVRGPSLADPAAQPAPAVPPAMPEPLLLELASEYEDRMKQWRDARPYSQQLADCHASFKALERKLIQACECGLLSRVVAAMSAAPPPEPAAGEDRRTFSVEELDALLLVYESTCEQDSYYQDGIDMQEADLVAQHAGGFLMWLEIDEEVDAAMSAIKGAAS